jgi:hypothetical protein
MGSLCCHRQPSLTTSVAMEFGTAVSIVNLVQAAIALVQAAKTVYARLNYASQEIEALQRKLMLMQAALHQFQEVTGRAHSSMLGEEFLFVLNRTLAEARKEIDELSRIANGAGDGRSPLSKVSWASGRRGKAKGSTAALAEAVDTLWLMLSIGTL